MIPGKTVRPSRPLQRKITSETGSTVKTSVGSIYRKSDIAEAKISLQRELTQSSNRSQSAEPRKKLEKISSLEKLEENDSDEQVQRQAQQADLSYPTESFQQSHTKVTSKDTEAGGFSLNLAIKRPKPNKGGPGLSCGPKIQKEVVLKKTKKKKKIGKDLAKYSKDSQLIRRTRKGHYKGYVIKFNTQ